eukprot:TRINITY_DN1935_c0_g1_i1.p1 TRINITY_DN1935_c0_g1~~TRINITY_DN1935_c0_g1_i1.p1  ORF type:complete len:265 (+),score=31.75 TRINITY_DN1935_c0_g1_i1:561-1355(+)
MDNLNERQEEVFRTFSEYLLPVAIWPAVCWGFLSWIVALHRKSGITRCTFAIAAVGSIPLTMLQFASFLICYMNIIGCIDYDNLQDFGITVLSSKFSNESASIYSFYNDSILEIDDYYCYSEESPLADAYVYFAITLPDCHGYESIQRIIDSESRLRIGSPGRGDCSGACSIKSCADLCLENSAERNISIEITNQWQTIDSAVGVVETVGFQLAELTPYSNLFKTLHDPICGPVLSRNIFVAVWTTLLLFFFYRCCCFSLLCEW